MGIVLFCFVYMHVYHLLLLYLIDSSVLDVTCMDLSINLFFIFLLKNEKFNKPPASNKPPPPSNNRDCRGGG